MAPRPNASFGPKSWTGQFSTASSSASAPRNASRNSRRRCRRAPASPSRCCRSCSPRSTTSSAVASSSRWPRTQMRATSPRRPAGSSATSPWPCSRHVVCAGNRALTDAAPIGERARALDVFERGGLVCVSAAALAEGMPPADARPAALRLAPGDEPGIDAIAGQLADAGYARVERVEERGHFAVRGGLVDVYPTTGREPLRIELFGDEIEQIRAFSPFTQRALRQVEQRRSIPPPSGAVSSWRSSFPTTTSRSACRPTSSRRSRGHPTSSGHPTRCWPSGTRRH